MELISAIATAAGRGGIAVIRVSGDGALSLARRMFSHAGEYRPNRMYAGEIDCGGFKDYGLCVYFRAPHSFTGEDVVEFHCHGGTEIARGVFARTVELGARPADRGEFTRRAFLNGKLSLAAAEGMADMINAESLAQVRAGYLLYGEALTGRTRAMQARLTECLAGIDADVDYPEEDLTARTREEVEEALEGVREEIGELLSKYRTGKKIKSGVSVALCGRPNAGKSALFNALVGYDRAIVSPEAGTTRDTVEGTTEIGGVLFRITDTAGLRSSGDAVEEEGVRRAERAVAAADVIVWLKEEDEPPVPFPAGTPVITVGAKSDLARREGCDVVLSSLTGEGVEELKRLLSERGMEGSSEGAFLMEERHYSALRDALEAAERGLFAVRSGAETELYAQDVKECWDALGLIGGETATESILEEIFSKFCVGK